MASKRALLPLPDSPETLATKCIKLSIPIDPPEYRQAFIGMLLNLTKWFSWDRDDSKMGALCALQFMPVLDSAISQLVTESATSSCEDDMPSFRQVGCNLEALIDGNWQTIYILQKDCVNDFVQLGIDDNSITINNYGVGASAGITDAIEDATVQNDLDAVWGGCLELTEYVFETARFFLDLLESVGSASEALSSIIRGANETIESVGKDKNGMDVTILEDVLIGNDGESNIDLPVDKTEPAKGLDFGRLLDILQSIVDAGVALLRAGLTETYLELVAGKLFNILTCVEGAPRQTTNIKLTTDDLNEWSAELTSGTLQDIFVGVVIVAQEIVGTLDFLSLLDLGDAFRQYMLGTLDPFPTWQVIVDDCPTTDTFYREFDFTINSHNNIFSSAVLFANPIIRPAQWDSGIGWNNMIFANGSGRFNSAYIKTVNFNTTTFTRIEFEWEIVKGNGVYHQFVLSQIASTSDLFQASLAGIANNVFTGTRILNNWNRTTTVLSFGVSGYWLNGIIPNGNVYLKKLRIWSSTPLPPQLLV